VPSYYAALFIARSEASPAGLEKIPQLRACCPESAFAITS
jgi:hypothetical protein